MNHICIRKAEFSDIEAICEIEHEGINSWTVTQFTEELNRQFSRFIIASISGIIAGYAVAWEIAGELQLNSIAVRKKFRQRGIGSLLIDNLVSSHCAAGISSILIEVRKKNTEAVSFYLKNGFQITGLRKNYYINDDALLMEKKII